jgi:magnesium chelatase subunit D
LYSETLLVIDMNHFSGVFPFSAIVGQELMKKALILNAINPRIGGVLIKGEKGTAKSTAVRGIAHLLPDREVVSGCTFGCDPHDPEGMCSDCRETKVGFTIETRRMRVIELPISATEDKVVGSLDIEHAVRKGETRFEPGILAKANRNILYVDEVNLLNDHIVDVLLDVAAMGVNIIEREGVSFSHPSSFILVGTMNPEEGELRPQLLDRFGLCAEVEGIRDPETRIELIRRRLAFERDPIGFAKTWSEKDTEIRDRILTARRILPLVEIPDPILSIIVQICIDMQVDGHRADIAIMKTASTLAAYHSRTEVNEEDVHEASVLVLSHRMRKKPFGNDRMEKEKIEETIKKSRQEPPKENKPHHHGEQQLGQKPDASSQTIFSEGEPFTLDQSKIKQLARNDELKREGSGRRSTSESSDGRYVRSRIPYEKVSDIAIDATIRAAALHQHYGPEGMALKIEPSDIRQKVRERRMGNTILFVVDASGSMGARQRMTAVKGAIFSLLIDAYQKRDRVGLVVFRGNNAELLLPPTSSVELARTYLQSLPTGGKTPLAQGIMKGLDVLTRERTINRNMLPLMVLISDGKANVAMGDGAPVEEAKFAASLVKSAGIPSLVIDSEQNFLSFGLAEDLSHEFGGRYVKLDDLAEQDLAGVVRGFGG